MSNRESMQTIDRSMLILKSFSREEDELSLADLHNKLNLSKSSLQRILNTLVLHGILEKDERKKTYRLGIELYFLGQLVERNSHLLSICKPFMVQLRDEFGEGVSLNIISQKKRKCIGYVEGKHELTTLSYIGQTSPLYAGASAKLLLAYLPEHEMESLLDELEFVKVEENTILSKEVLLQNLKKIRDQGYSISFNERIKGAFAISAPIKNRLGEVIAGITISVPTVRINQEQMDLYIIQITKYASLISNKLVEF
jgi:IclR family transcriptional regulator, KDG regulon repressor